MNLHAQASVPMQAGVAASWHKCEVPSASSNVRFQGNPDDICSHRVLLSLTQRGHGRTTMFWIGAHKHEFGPQDSGAVEFFSVCRDFGRRNLGRACRWSSFFRHPSATHAFIEPLALLHIDRMGRQGIRAQQGNRIDGRIGPQIGGMRLMRLLNAVLQGICGGQE